MEPSPWTGDAVIHDAAEIRDPATLEVVGRAPTHGPADVDRAVAITLAAANDWSADQPARLAVLRRVAADLLQREDEFAQLITREQGKTLTESRAEVRSSAGLLAAAAELPWDERLPLPARDGRRVSVDRRPVGPVAAITPWNYPLALLASKLGPAMAAGCTVVVKPAMTTPLSTQLLIELIAAVTPDGVVTGVYGDAEVSRSLSEHEGIRKVSFTGSVAVGSALMKQAARSLKRLTLELGGNDPAIVLDDVDVTETARRIVESAFRNARQVCLAVKRVYVRRGLADAMTEALAAAARETVVGHGIDQATTMGPHHASADRERVRSLIDAAVSDGGTLVVGGNPGCSLPGYFLAPAVVGRASHTTALVQQEQFGAALPIVSFDDTERLIEGLNREPHGLAASVWSADLERAETLARRLDVGTVWVNQHSVMEVDAPFGGWRLSGLGRERGIWGLEEYLETRTINVRSDA
jgi:acyl-CoA reductase-like NAD-dependent aldehyde dehydrogenase